MKTNNETKVKKVSLLRDVFSIEPFSKRATEIDKDEMVIHVRNKLSYLGMTITSCLLTIYAFCADSFKLEHVGISILFILGITNYIMLVGFCKTGVVKHSQAWTALIYSIITLPCTLTGLVYIPFDKYKFGGFVLILAVPFAITFYQIANTIYKKSIITEGENDEI